MEHQDSSSNMRKNKNDDKKEATLPMDSSRTDEMPVPICPHSQGEEKKHRQLPHSIGKNTFISDFDLKGGSSRDYMCITCDRQFSKAGFCSCHRKLVPIIDGREYRLKSLQMRAREWLLPDPITSNLSGGGTSSMHSHGSSSKIIGFAHKDSDSDNEMEGMHSLDHTFRHHALIATIPDVSEEIKSETSQTDLSASDSPSTVKSSRRLQLLGELHEGMSSAGRVQGGLVLWGDSSSDGSARDIETGGTPSSGRVQGGPTLVLLGDSSAHGYARNTETRSGSAGRVHGALRLVLSGDSSSRGFTDDIEIGHTHSSSRVAMVDPLLGVIVQGACSLVAYKKSEGFSRAKDFLLYVLVFVYVLGFLSALGAKLFTRYKKLGVIALVAAALAFLMTMALVVI